MLRSLIKLIDYVSNSIITSGQSEACCLLCLKSPHSHPKSSFAVILKNPPKELNDPKDRKAFIDNLRGDSKSAITELRPGKDTWRLVVSDKNEATAVADAIKSKDQSLRLQLKVLSVLWNCSFRS